MEEHEVLGRRQDFLLLNYTNMDFVVNRSQFSGSTSIDELRKINSSISFINSIFTFNDQKILLFDCDDFLRQTYSCDNGNRSRLCLLMRMENFSKKIRPLIAKILAKSSKLSKEYFGLIITSHSEIRKLEIEEIYLSPKGIRRHLNRNGLYGCRFPVENRIQYYIDLEIIILNAIKGRKL